MKRILPLLLLLAGVMAAPAQQYLTLAQKRVNLVSGVRTVGPLEPSDWIFPRLSFTPNYDYAYSDVTYHSQGNYGYVNLGSDPSGQYAYFYDYK